MRTFRIVGVPEHFNFPFRQLAKFQPLENLGIRIDWKEESRGSGQMSQDLKEGKADMAILLTESFMREFELGSPFRILGFHVESPLNWGIHVKNSHPAETVQEITNKHFLVSRMGSGSHLMALALADSMSWDNQNLNFEIVGNMDGAREAFENGNEGLFLWEKFTTAPQVRANSMKRIGEIPSPWPCFVMVVTEKALEEFQDVILEIREEIYTISEKTKEIQGLAGILAKNYDLAVEDVEAWLPQTHWCTHPEVSREKLLAAMDKMKTYGILQNSLPIEDFLVTKGMGLLP